MSLADAFGADNAYDPSQGVDELARQTFPGDIPDGYAADPGRLSDLLLWRMDRTTRYVKLPSSYGKPVITGSNASSFGEVVRPRRFAIIALGLGDFLLIKYFPVVGPCVPVPRLIAILAFGLVALFVGTRISRDREATKNHRSQIDAQTRAAANCGGLSVLIAHGEQDSEIPRTCSLAGHFVQLKRNVP